jgi:hypothetical protein
MVTAILIPVTFVNENIVIVYPLENIISHFRKNQYIIIAQCMWRVASRIGIYERLVKDIYSQHSLIPVSTVPFSARSNVIHLEKRYHIKEC